MINKWFTVCLLVLPVISFANGMQCGPFHLEAGNDGLMHINDQAPETQKMTFLKQKDDFDNVKMQWMLQDAKIGRWLGLDYIKRDKKDNLNVEVIRTNMDEPRRFWTYDCQRVK